ncbi:hypothetical protein EI546_06515 [Aequorivita sp. H23M31]|uniref:Uncharacterized protein n=1 Tax=Aequorivita ciconiae TaxID=2494375 RepID=A0A410G2A9_9FLAO|nr:hypothetical protein [Aequorivita sp. H23M31]QAA81402.1 hypothetical protein EI546_06515 [Aequorivita sp. H23M31]
MLKRIMGLALNRAPLRQYYLEIGAYLLKKGSNVEIGQILKVKNVKPGVQQVKVVTEMYFSFHDNKITHRTGTRVLRK